MNKGSADISIQLGRNIAKARKSVGKTQAQLAEQIDVDTLSISRIERGAVAPSLATLSKIANAIDMPLPHLFTGTSTAPHAMADSIACLLDKLPENRRLFLYNQIQAWCDYFNSERIFTATTDKKQE
ncbi:MAG: helix-turn-helix transcriptional regulator [Oxalobacter sp.]|nr:helix-turn-helix transcriptional regulator [Oxalobacter sp.]